MSGKKILVTGSEGFIGKSLCVRLEKEGHIVTRFDRKKERYNLNVCAEGTLDQFPNIDLVIHLAAQTSVYRSVEEITLDAWRNIIGTISVLEYCRDRKIRLIYAASGGTCYGRVGGGLLEMMPSESVMSCDNSPYGFSKQVGEGYCELYDSLFGVKYYSLRFSNVFGLDGKGVIESWLKKIHYNNGEDLYINGTGLQSRDFVYIDDCIEAFIRTIPCILEPEVGSQVMNIASEKSFNMMEIAKIICNITGFDVLDKVNYRLAIPYEVDDHLLRCEIAKDILGWWPKVELEEGIKLIWEKLKHESTHTTIIPGTDS